MSNVEDKKDIDTTVISTRTNIVIATRCMICDESIPLYDYEIGKHYNKICPKCKSALKKIVGEVNDRS